MMQSFSIVNYYEWFISLLEPLFITKRYWQFTSYAINSPVFCSLWCYTDKEFETLMLIWQQHEMLCSYIYRDSKYTNKIFYTLYKREFNVDATYKIRSLVVCVCFVFVYVRMRQQETFNSYCSSFTALILYICSSLTY